MRRCIVRRLAIVSATLVILVSWLGGQSRPAKTNSAGETAQNAQEFPTFDVAFTGEQLPVVGFISTPLISSRTQCSTNGTVFVEMFTPPNLQTRQIYSISSSNEIHQFSTSGINDLYDVTVVDTFAGDSSVVVLLRATPNDRQEKRTYVFSTGGREEKTVFIGEHHSYIATFSLDGTYKGRVAVDDTVISDHVAVFGSGVFVVLGFDQQRTKPILALLKADGTLLQFLDLTQDFADWVESVNTASIHRDPNAPPPLRKHFVLSPMTQFLPFHDNLLMVEEGSNLPIFELRDSGAMRPIKLKVPDKHVMDTLIPSQDHLYVRTSADRSAQSNSWKTDSTILEVDPNEGQILRRLRIVGATANEIACYGSSQFAVLRLDEKGRLVRMTGLIQSSDAAKP
jgi:hypothetical protein